MQSRPPINSCPPVFCAAKTDRKEIAKLVSISHEVQHMVKYTKRKRKIKPSPVALFAKKMRPAHVPHTGFPVLTNSRKAGNYRHKKD